MTADATDVPAEPTPAPQPQQRPLYEASTQFRNWRFSTEQLAANRKSLNAAAVNGIRELLERESPGSSEGVKFLDADEEHTLVTYYCRVVTSMCARIGLAEEVEATAVSYLKRFYLKNTVMDWHPMNVMITILFLATKTCNMPVSLDYYVSKLPSGKTSAQDVLELEFLVAQSLSFEFTVWHAHKALWGIALDLQSLPELDQESAKRVHATALGHMRAARLTDAELIYTPSQIAIACIYIADAHMAETYLAAKGSANMLTLVQEVADLIEREGKGADVGLVKEIDRRLKLCKNPERVPGTKLYEARQAKADAAAEKKRSLKAASTQESMKSQEEMFGPSIALPPPSETERS
ncbi:Cyclin, C-terminal domain [Ceratobasidium sp. AG-Ba]|nr:Cyclin, C-terminal domain [Ceratobasidium sp. AG-Ba]QRW05286.1 Cyclin, C-terminal domain [Ceratobasidium sp. AG-Ba]